MWGIPMPGKSDDRKPSCEQRIAETIHTARKVFASQFPSEDFDSVVWKLGSLNDRPGVHPAKSLWFSRLKRRDEPLPDQYADLIKSWIVLDGLGSAVRVDELTAARCLWEVLLHRNNRAENFRWETLTLDDLCQAELFLISNRGERNAYHRVIYLKKLVNFLEARQICPPLHFTMQVPRPEHSNDYISRERAGEGSKLPSQRALQGLATIYQQLAQEPADRLRIAAVALLVVTGFRIGELLTLPLDCEEVEVHRGKQRYGLRSYPRKIERGDLKTYCSLADSYRRGAGKVSGSRNTIHHGGISRTSPSS
jgi:hypothetical protein